MSGPKPTPTAALALRGSWRAKTRSEEPQPELLADAKPPRGFPKEARAIWRDMAPRLIGTGLLTLADLPSFARYCRLYAAWSQAMTDVEEEPSRSNVLKLATLDDMLRRLEANFGLSPADRAGLAVPAPTSNDKARFFAA